VAKARGFNLGSQRRRRGWDFGPGGNDVSTLSASGELILGQGFAAAIDGLTIARIRGSLQAYLTAASAAGSGFHCAIGICIVNEDAFSVGSSAVPDPIADALWDGWMYHRFFDLHAQTTTLADGVNAVSAGIQFEVDTKAMRKMRDEDVLTAKVEVVEVGTSTMDVWFDSRALFLLP